MSTVATQFVPVETTTRISFSMVAAIVLTLALLILMQQLIASKFSPPKAILPAKIEPVILPKSKPLVEIRKKPEPPEPITKKPLIDTPVEPAINDNPGPTFSEPAIKVTTPGSNGSLSFDNSSLIKQVAVAPIYPRRAIQKEIEGFVDIQFVVTPAGSTTDIRIVQSQPQGVFDRAAIAAVKKWKYLPRVTTGTHNNSITERIQFILEK